MLTLLVDAFCVELGVSDGGRRACTGAGGRAGTGRRPR